MTPEAKAGAVQEKGQKAPTAKKDVAQDKGAQTPAARKGATEEKGAKAPAAKKDATQEKGAKPSAAKEGEAPKKGFVATYWMLILGVLLAIIGVGGMIGLRLNIVQVYILGDPLPAPWIGRAEPTGHAASAIPYVIGLIMVIFWGMKTKAPDDELVETLDETLSAQAKEKAGVAAKTGKPAVAKAPEPAKPWEAPAPSKAPAPAPVKTLASASAPAEEELLPDLWEEEELPQPKPVAKAAPPAKPAAPAAKPAETRPKAQERPAEARPTPQARPGEKAPPSIRPAVGRPTPQTPKPGGPRPPPSAYRDLQDLRPEVARDEERHLPPKHLSPEDKLDHLARSYSQGRISKAFYDMNRKHFEEEQRREQQHLPPHHLSGHEKIEHLDDAFKMGLISKGTYDKNKAAFESEALMEPEPSKPLDADIRVEEEITEESLMEDLDDLFESVTSGEEKPKEKKAKKKKDLLAEIEDLENI
jgi:hypothetical protein